MTKRYVAILHKHYGSVRKAVLVPPGQSLDFDKDAATRLWLRPHLGSDYHLVEFVELTPDEPSGCTPKLPPHGCTCWFMGKDDVRLDHDKDCPVRIRRELDQDFPENRNGDV